MIRVTKVRLCLHVIGLCAVAMGVYIFLSYDKHTDHIPLKIQASASTASSINLSPAYQTDNALVHASNIGTRQSSSVVLTVMKRVLAQTNLASLYFDLISSAPPGSKIIDIGLAHAKECFSAAEAKVHCIGFEANPVTAKAIQEARSQNVLLKQYSKIFHAAVGSENGEAQFIIENGSGPYAVGSHFGAKAHHNTSYVVTVPVVTLDAALGEVREPFFMLKSDTQGHELGVLHGARQLFRNKMVKFVFIEMAVYLMPGLEKDSIAIIDFLNENGFVCFDLPSHDASGNLGPLNHNVYAPSATLWTEQNGKHPFFTDLLCELTT